MALWTQLSTMVPGDYVSIDLLDETGCQLMAPWPIVVPKIVIRCVKYGANKARYFDYNPEFREFCFKSWEIGISVKRIEDFIFDKIGMRPMIFHEILEKDKIRYEEGRKNRFNRIKDELESTQDFDNIPRTKEEIQYASAVSRAKMMVASRTIAEYREKREDKLEVSGNLAQIIIEPKEEE